MDHDPTLPLAPTDVHIWLIGEHSVAQEHLLEWRSLLSPDELIRLERFRFLKDRNLFLLAHAHVRRVLSRYAPIAPAAWQFQATKLGRPEIALEPYRTNLHFSLSHTPGLVAVAVGRVAEVGVDVENVDRQMDVKALAEYAFTAQESQHLAGYTESAFRTRFLEIWTLKEAYAKARGLGMSLPFDQFAFDVRGDEIKIHFDEATPGDRASSWQFHLQRPGSNHQLALAVRKAGGDNKVRMQIETKIEAAPGSVGS
jgi:4'-phosphopantetheinyl transferase